MSVKRDWPGMGQAPRAAYRHQVVDGVSTGSRYEVLTSTVIGSERGPEAGRRIVEWLAPNAARERAQELIRMADEAERQNAEM